MIPILIIFVSNQEPREWSRRGLAIHGRGQHLKPKTVQELPLDSTQLSFPNNKKVIMLVYSEFVVPHVVMRHIERTSSDMDTRRRHFGQEPVRPHPRPAEPATTTSSLSQVSLAVPSQASQSHTCRRRSRLRRWVGRFDCLCGRGRGRARVDI